MSVVEAVLLFMAGSAWPILYGKWSRRCDHAWQTQKTARVTNRWVEIDDRKLRMPDELLMQVCLRCQKHRKVWATEISDSERIV